LTVQTDLLLLLRTPPQPASTLFPYTTLFRSRGGGFGSEAGKGSRSSEPGDRATPRGPAGCGCGGNDGRRRAGWHRSARRSRSRQDRKSTRLNSSHVAISYAVFCLKKKKTTILIPFHTPYAPPARRCGCHGPPARRPPLAHQEQPARSVRPVSVPLHPAALSVRHSL